MYLLEKAYLKNGTWICTWIYTNFSGSFEATEKIQAKGGLLTITCTGGNFIKNLVWLLCCFVGGDWELVLEISNPLF